ncbi:MAG: histidine kinase, partial [Bacteroidota bacterium]
ENGVAPTAGLGKNRAYFAIPSVLIGGWFLYRVYQIVYVSQSLKYFHDILEEYAAVFALLHILAGIGFFLVDNRPSMRGLILVTGVGLFSLLGLVYYSFTEPDTFFHREHALFVFNLLLFFPLVNAAFLQLQFGKVSLVITRTIQYLVIAILSIFLYLLIAQLYAYLQPSVQYRRLLEFVTFMLIALVVRVIYLANQNKVNRYFVTPQQERLTRFKAFIAQIPQYTSRRMLRKDLVEQLSDYFDSQTAYLWWKGDPPDNEAERMYQKKQEEVYQALKDNKTVWSRTKEIATFSMADGLEEMVQKSPYFLVCPITVDEENFALLMLGKKRRGVYNLSDLELISQLIQQTQLTLNVLQLYAREKELIQQTYEANLTALRSQINPHFLFNTLNSIGELVHESADLAEQAVEKLAYIFRYTLRMSSQNYVSLSDEMSLISTYLDLEKIRFGERLNVHIEVAPEVKDTQIPAFILMTLTENCVKHGIAKILHKGIVSVEAFRDDQFLVCEVYDNGPGIDLSRIYKSTGLSNSIARLENIYDRKNLLEFENTGEGTMVRMRIPLEEGAKLS